VQNERQELPKQNVDADRYFAKKREEHAEALAAAHPRKGAGTTQDTMGDRQKITLANNPEEFFEATMGSSHFINSTGSLWGIERDEEDQTTILLGSQRVTGRQSDSFCSEHTVDVLS
jgi:hypothetical protein